MGVVIQIKTKFIILTYNLNRNYNLYNIIYYLGDTY